jgi:hypothetical protein
LPRVVYFMGTFRKPLSDLVELEFVRILAIFKHKI